MIELNAGDYFRQKVETAALMARHTESPIEILLGMALLEVMEHDWELIPQFKWRRYRIDWVLQVPDKTPIFIECDGNEFHTRPEQVARDRARDVRIRRAGIRLFRFTGSEIYRNAAGIAEWICAEARK